MALDGIELNQTICDRTSQNECTFELDQACGFSPQNQAGHASWQVYQAKEVDPTGELHDHTLGTADGHFFGIDFALQSKLRL